MNEWTELQGPVLKVNGQLMLLVPLEDGGAEFVDCARGVSEVEGPCLKIAIPDWLAGMLRIDEGDIVCVSNWDGKLGRFGRSEGAAGAMTLHGRAFTKFDVYQLAKHDSDRVGVRLRDVLFLCHAKLKDVEQAAVWKKLVENTLDPPLRHLGGWFVRREGQARELRTVAARREARRHGGRCYSWPRRPPDRTFSDACVELPPRRGFALRLGADRGLHCGRGGRGCGVVR